MNGGGLHGKDELAEGLETSKESIHQANQTLVYALNPALLTEFAAFYKETIMPWLKARMVTGSAMIIGNSLIAEVSSNNPPWTGVAEIPNFHQFVASRAPVIERLPDLLI